MNGLNHYRAYGNTPIHDAEIICVIDDQKFQMENVCMVNRIWDQHLILVGDVPRGKQVQVSKQPVSCGLTVTQHVKGWDVQDIRSLPEEITSLVSDLQQEEVNFGPIEKEVLCELEKQRWHPLISSDSFNVLLNLAFSSPEERTKKRCELEKLVDAGLYVEFGFSIKALLSRAKVTNAASSRIQLRDIFLRRQASLQEEMDQQVAHKKKVIVFCEQIQLEETRLCEFLKTKKFAVVAHEDLNDPFEHLEVLEIKET